MSTWTGINSGNPESTTYITCSWTFCTRYVPQRFSKAGVALCREHALFTWSIVNEQLNEGQSFEPPFGEPLAEFEETQPDTPAGYVYYLRTGGRIKIGYTTNLGRRLSQYPPDLELLYIQPGTKHLERSEHHRYRAYLADGREWFQDRPEVTQPIQEQAAQTPFWRDLALDEWWRRKTATNTVSTRHAQPPLE